MKTKIWLLLFATALVVTAISCHKKPTENQTPAKHYRLKGKVVSIDKQGKMLNIENEAIPGFMDAMTMPYKVKPESELDQLHPGDAIAADLLVEDEGAWIENVVVTGHSEASPAK